MSTSKLLENFDWVQSPLVINAPMAGVATPKLAVAVSKAGGLGFLGAIFNFDEGSAQISLLDKSLAETRSYFDPGFTKDARLPVGMALITSDKSTSKFCETTLPVLKKHRPAAIWLFAPDGITKTHPDIIKGVKEINPAPLVFVQVGNITAAREAVEDGADVIVAQGTDAGGHQFRRGSGIITLLPEMKSMLEEEFPDRGISLVAAGGIIDSRGAAAAFVLGAEAVVMGTRFTVSTESTYADFRKNAIIDAKDGGLTTLKSPFCDQINRSDMWGPLYDGRAICSKVHYEHLNGKTLDECLKLLEEYPEEQRSQMTKTWAGAGVGLVKKMEDAKDIVAEVQKGTKEILGRASSLV